ncbi:MAG TPA: peptidoglycan-binding domain-containing protein [Chthoniobacterales bacterium]|jgi:hypothetical protein
MRSTLITLLVSVCLLPFASLADNLFYTDPLAQRDDLGLLHQMPYVNRVDLAPRHCRIGYYFQSGVSLTSDPAYVGALQTALYRRGYYCGPVDGVFSVEVSAAIARMQRNNSQIITGTLTRGVRSGLHLP